jgi:hypothetical protein
MSDVEFISITQLSPLEFGVWCNYCDLPTAWAMTFGQEVDFQADRVFTMSHCVSCNRWEE